MMSTGASAPAPKQTLYLLQLAEGLPAPTLASPFLFFFFFCDRVVNCELQPLIENSVWDFNLVGVVTSRVTLIY